MECYKHLVLQNESVDNEISTSFVTAVLQGGRNV